MKKLVGFLLLTIMFVFPFSANAGLVGYGYLDLTASGPDGGGYRLDYDASTGTNNFNYYLNNAEVFCVSHQDMHDTTFDFYTITPDLSNYAQLSKAAWIADNWTDWGTSDYMKGEAQKAVWKIIGVMDITGTTGEDYDMYLAASKVNNYVTNNWLFALSPSETTPNAPNYQDYLTPYTAVPEPASLLLFGLGLLGLAGLRRKMK